MADNTLEERGRALENQFFDKENKEKIAAMKEKLAAQTTREELRKASGLSDDAVIDKLSELGLRGNTLAALSLVPLVSVAWADGEIQDNERTQILLSAHAKGLEHGSPGHELLESWLSNRPSDELLEAWIAYIKALRLQLTEEQNLKLKNTIVGFTKMIATASGGLLGFGKVSKAEEQAIARVEAAFHA
ncbi:MAG: hypothetical protein ACTHU0_07955 [Kofleriaceae bacterium]